MLLLRQKIALLLCLISLGYITYSLLVVLPFSNGHRVKFSPHTGPPVPDSTANATHILIVSAFFPLPNSTHPSDNYTIWLSKFLAPVKTHIYLFAPPDMEATVRQLRGSLPITVDTTYGSPFDIPPLEGLEGEYQSMWEEGTRRRPYAYVQSAMWNAKPYLLHHAVRNEQLLRREVYEYVFWNDADGFRDGQMDDGTGLWPDSRRVDAVWREGSDVTGTPKEDLLFCPILDLPHASMRLWSESLGPVRSLFSQGTFFGGTPGAISWLNRAFYAYHDFYLFRGRAPVGSDQSVFNSLLLLFPERFVSVWEHDPEAPAYIDSSKDAPLGLCGDSLFYYQFFVASEEDVDVLRDFWTSRVSWLWRMWKNSQSCRRTRLLAMKDVLERQFGHDWVPPTAGIDISGSYRP